MNEVNTHGSTPLLVACKDGHLDVVKYLIEIGRDSLNKINNSGNHAMHMACVSGNIDLINFIIKIDGCDSLNIVNNSKQTPFTLACFDININVIKFILIIANIIIPDIRYSCLMKTDETRALIESYKKNTHKTKTRLILESSTMEIYYDIIFLCDNYFTTAQQMII